MNECSLCGYQYEPYLVNESCCIDCAIEVNNHIISLNTDIKGYCKNKKLLRRRYQLRELRPVKYYTGRERINQICKGCNEVFVTFASFKDRLNYCNYCKKLREKLTKAPIDKY